MLLNKLREYADERMTAELPPLYAMTPVAWIVALGLDGRPLSLQPISTIDPSNPRGKRGLDMAAPEIQRAAGIKPLLLADKGTYTFGRTQYADLDEAERQRHAQDEPDAYRKLVKGQERAEKAHDAYRKMLDRCAAQTQEPAVLAVQRFYERGGADLLDLSDQGDYGHKVAFKVQLADGTYSHPHDLPSVQRFWLSEHTPGTAALGQCVVCGEHQPVLDRMQTKIKGIVGGQSSGTSIISANEHAFESYGLEASRVAPTCRECAEDFHRALNHLLADDRGSLRVGDATFVFWTRDNVAFDVRSFMTKPDSAAVRALLESVGRGRQAALDDDAPFYAAALSANGGRTVVRDWLDTTVANAANNVSRWFRLQRVVDPRDEDPTGVHPRPLGLFALAASTVRDVRRDLPVSTPRALFRAAIDGTSLPTDIAYQAVRRCRADQGVTRPRAALIKLVLLSQESHQPKEDYMVALEPGHPSTAYHCGRLLAVLEAVQRAALPGVNATIVDRYYGAASSTPATVFGALIRGAQPHLAKLQRDRPGAHVNLQRNLEDVCAQIEDWPPTLALKDQALFSLGYYHQRAHDRAESLSRRTARNDKTDQEDTNTDTGRENLP
ncbi:MAG: type I-C CRISPR-associated protein Cas8c/Csd1 [Acidimicrobiaceae bacterium]|nr:type I-C CRISPR-associated protein Cas8c/Csd1 [Acidimicrobiaceae bacterium]MDE0655738.1 type I-C CRISPR-associated protein Cas8c/Csd1 [Acidimicrobiaceae bacterium]